MYENLHLMIDDIEPQKTQSVPKDEREIVKTVKKSNRDKTPHTNNETKTRTCRKTRNSAIIPAPCTIHKVVTKNKTLRNQEHKIHF
jgi:hypothetical protein